MEEALVKRTAMVVVGERNPFESISHAWPKDEPVPVLVIPRVEVAVLTQLVPSYNKTLPYTGEVNEMSVKSERVATFDVPPPLDELPEDLPIKSTILSF